MENFGRVCGYDFIFMRGNKLNEYVCSSTREGHQIDLAGGNHIGGREGRPTDTTDINI